MESKVENIPPLNTVPGSKTTINKTVYILPLSMLLIGLILGIIIASSKQNSPQLSSAPSPVIPPTIQNNLTFRQGEAISFSFTYPLGWNAFSEETETSSETVEIFRLDPNPIWNFPEYSTFIEGKGSKTSPANFIQKINEFTSHYKSVKLDWKIGSFQGECYTYDTVSDKWGEIKNSINCFVLIPGNLNKDRGYNGDLLFEFNFFNTGNLNEVDPDRAILKRFIGSLKPITSSKSFSSTNETEISLKPIPEDVFSKKYTSKKLGYSLRYPSYFYAFPDGYLSLEPECTECVTPPGFFPEGRIVENPSNISLLDLVKKEFSQQGETADVYRIEQVNINNKISAVLPTYIGPIGGTRTTYVYFQPKETKSPTVKILIQFDNQELVKDIISTLEF